MSLEPSFYNLFRRSRYERDDDPDSSTSLQNRRELFAVTAVAFTLKHDERFCEHFLTRICGLNWSPASSVPEIEIQPHYHSDLAIKLNQAPCLCVIEFKVGASLENKQNPSRTEFDLADGYGKLIQAEPGYAAFKRKTYIVLDEFTAFDKEIVRGDLVCRSRVWIDLIPGGEVVCKLWKDLLDSLGRLGVSTLQDRLLRHMNNAQFTPRALVMHETLRAIASRSLGLRRTPSEDINRNVDEVFYGLNIPVSSSSRLQKLQELVKASGDVMGWFGYQAGSRPPSEPQSETAVWFYCSTPDAARATIEFLKNSLKACRVSIPGKFVGPLEDNSITFNSAGDTSLGDKEWFEAVFAALADNRPQPSVVSDEGA